MNSHTFKVSELTSSSPRETKITFSDEITGVCDDVIVKQNNTFYFNHNSLEMIVDDSTQLSLTNNTGCDVSWESSDPSIATVDNNGNIKAISRGNATISASTTDKTHKCACKLTIKDITDYVSAYCTSASITSINGLIKSGSTFTWKFTNNSSDAVKLVSLQLVDGQTGSAGNEMIVNSDVEASNSVAYTTTIGIYGIHAPVTCRFKFEHNSKSYTKTAVYTGNW